MLKKIHSQIIILFILYSHLFCQTQFYSFKETSPDSLELVSIKSDTLFNSKQSINLLAIHKNYLAKFRIALGYSKTELKKTSEFGKNKNALAAINAGFFNRDKGGSVTYLEVNDSVINRSTPANKKWGKSNSLMNGAFIITNKNKIKIETARRENYYEKSKREKAVLLTGPLLLLNSQKVKLPDVDFVNKRHPRTCAGLTKDRVVFITIDGRSKEAEGMNLFEVQNFLTKFGFTDAINFDGGGSTTMWLRNKGIINSPSDTSGERPVANVVLIQEK